MKPSGMGFAGDEAVTAPGHDARELRGTRLRILGPGIVRRETPFLPHLRIRVGRQPAVAPDRPRREFAEDGREVRFLHLARGEKRAQDSGRPGVAREQDQPGRLPVEPVHHIELAVTLLHEHQERIVEITSRGVDGEHPGLCDCEKLRALQDHLVRRVDLRFLDPVHVEHDHVAGVEPARRPDPDAVDRDPALADDVLPPGPGLVGEPPGEEMIEPYAFEFGSCGSLDGAFGHFRKKRGFLGVAR